METMSTVSISSRNVKASWWLVDAKGVVLGKLGTTVAHILRGKHRPEYTPHMNHQDKVVVINAANIRVTGKKMQDKLYHKHTGYVGHLRTVNLETMMKKHPTRAVEKAIKGMLPHNRLGRDLYRNLYVYANEDHRHTAQKPIAVEIDKSSS